MASCCREDPLKYPAVRRAIAWEALISSRGGVPLSAPRILPGAGAQERTCPGEFGQRRGAKLHERTENSAGRWCSRKDVPGRIRPAKGSEAPRAHREFCRALVLKKGRARENSASEGERSSTSAPRILPGAGAQERTCPGEFGQRRGAKLHERTENSAGRWLTSEGRKHAPGRIRIPNLLIRSQVLYPVELRALDMSCVRNQKIPRYCMPRRGFEPPRP